MTSHRYGLVLRQVGRLLGGGSVASLGTGQLLERFAVDRDEAAFEALVGRHGPMVLGTCRRMLPDPHDVDDAFQATFLVLARKAGSIRDADRLGPWLHGVARRVATRSRALSARRNSRERSTGEEPAAEAPDLLEGFELRAALDEELSRLPEKYRAPLVLCYLEGLTHDEAAEQLRWPVGTVRSRLAGGRDRLRARLARRGLAPTATVPAILPHASIPQALLSTTVQVATSAGSAPAHVAALAKGALVAMMWNKFKMVAALGLMAGMTAGGAGVAAQRGGEDASPAKETMAKQVGAVLQERSLLKEELGADVRMLEQIRFDRANEVRKLEERAAKIRKQIDSVELRWKDLVANADSDPSATGPSNDLQAANKEIKRLEAELRASRAETQDVRRKRDVQATEIARPFLEGKASPKPANPAKESAQAPGTGTGGGPTPAPSEKPSTAEEKRTVNPFRRPASPMVVPMGETHVMLIPGEQDRVTVLNTETGMRATQRFAEGVTEVIPIVSPGRVSLRFKGPEVRQVVAYDHQGGKWYPQDLVEPTTEANPVLGGRELIYQLGRFVYVFSFQAKKWGVLELKRDPGRQSSLPGMNATQNGKMVIPEDDLIHIYDPKTGEWTHIDTKDEGAK